MPDPDESSPLSTAAEHVRSALLIALDYTKVACQVHGADQFGPALDLANHLTASLHEIERLKRGRGRKGRYIGGITAE